MRKLRSVQVLRCVAACAVALMHARFFSGSTIADSPTRLGAAGVDLFFVVSGFIMASLDKRSAGRFLFDRAWRVLPLWFIAVLPWLIWKRPTGPTLLASLTLWPVYGRFTAPVLTVGWTLSFELLFYACIALAMRTKLLVPLSLFGVSLCLAGFAHRPIFDFIGNPIIFEFLFGWAIAELPRDERLGISLMILSVVLLAVSPLTLFSADVAVDARLSGWRVLFWGVPAAFSVYGCVSLERRFQSQLFNPLVLLGDASYSIYLFHLGFIWVLHMDWIAEAALSILGGVFVWWLVERRLLNMKPAWELRTAPNAMATLR